MGILGWAPVPEGQCQGWADFMNTEALFACPSAILGALWLDGDMKDMVPECDLPKEVYLL